MPGYAQPPQNVAVNVTTRDVEADQIGSDGAGKER